MEIKRKYRRFILWCLCLDLLAMGITGYRYLDRKIPDEIRVERGMEDHVEAMLARPFVTFEDAVTVSGEGSYLLPCRLMGVVPFKNVKVIPSDSTSVYVSGSTVGLYMETEGVLIVDTGEITTDSGTTEEPAKNIVKSGDYIVSLNEQKISSKKELMEDLSLLDGGEVTMDVRRGDETIPVSMTPVKDTEGKYKLGIWVRDDTQGIGTLTYIDSSGTFGALGHGISDVDTGELLEIREGELYQAEILGIQKGSKGSPGELAGLIRYEPGQIIGKIGKNSGNGIYGEFNANAVSEMSLMELAIAYKQEVEIGPASIVSSVDGTAKMYDAEITKIDMNHEDSNKSFVIQVTDPELLEITGGIVQGMSGSPVIQNGKFVGAVTHVFVQDSTSGYGIFAETMLDEAESCYG